MRGARGARERAEPWGGAGGGACPSAPSSGDGGSKEKSAKASPCSAASCCASALSSAPRRVLPLQTAFSPRACLFRYGDLQPQRRGEQLGPPGPGRRRPACEARAPAVWAPAGGGSEKPGSWTATAPGVRLYVTAGRRGETEWRGGSGCLLWTALEKLWEEPGEMVCGSTCAACKSTVAAG